VRPQVFSLGLVHHLVTKYTSLVAVDTTPSRPDGEPLNSHKLPHNLPHDWDYGKVFGGAEADRLQEEVAIMPSLMIADAGSVSSSAQLFADVSASGAMSATARVGLALPKTATPAPLHFAAGLALALFALAVMMQRRRLA
jgi:Ca-activated chloride channel family protein